MAKRSGKRPEIQASIMQELAEYTDEVQSEIEALCNKLSKEGTKELKKRSRRSSNSGEHYADGWTGKVTKSGGKIDVTIRNRLKPNLTHLLEHGWKTTSGKTVEGDKVIGTVEDELEQKLVDGVEKIIKDSL